MGFSDVIPYQQEAINFLQTCTFNFPPFADMINTDLNKKGYTVDLGDPFTWKYWMNLEGKYHTSDTMMTVFSLDTQEQIDFTVANLKRHKKTFNYYKPGSEGFPQLCRLYPGQTNLIKNILFPVEDIEKAYASDYFELLAYGEGYLEHDERNYVLSELKDYITYVKDRWYLDFLSYEEYFFIAFYATFLQSLYGAILTARIKAIKTYNVHTFHLWEYLKSKGLGDYRAILNRKQSMFLYRNINYILANQGKQSTLVLLADNLLSDIGIALVGRTIYQHTEGGSDDLRTIPDFLAEPVPTIFADIVTIDPPVPTSDIIYRVNQMGLDYPPTFNYVDRVERRVGYTDLNILPTKFVELKPIPRDKKYAEVFNNFCIDTLVTCLNTGKYNPKITILDEISGISSKMDGKTAFLFLMWCLARGAELLPDKISKWYFPKASFKFDVPSMTLPNQYINNGRKYVINQSIDVTGFIAGAEYPQEYLFDPTDFSYMIHGLFKVLLKQHKTMRHHDGKVPLDMFKIIFNAITDQKPYPINFTDAETFDEFFALSSNMNINQVKNLYENNIDATTGRLSKKSKENYEALAFKTFEGLIPVISEFLEFSDEFTPLRFYQELKKLFIQLTSYNILFLETEPSNQQYIFIPKTVVEFTSIEDESTIHIDITLGISLDKFEERFIPINIGKPDVKIDFVADMHQYYRLVDYPYVHFANAEMYHHLNRSGMPVVEQGESDVSLMFNIAYPITVVEQPD